MNEYRLISSQTILNLEIPDFIFRPNEWTDAFLAGLEVIPMEDKWVAEIGVGTGLVGIDLLQRGVREYIGLDIDPRIIPIALRNITKIVPESLHKVKLIHSDLLESLPQNHSFDIICGCLPQVSKPSAIDFSNADSYARYFDAQKYQSSLNVYGLGLNEAVLAQAKTRLRPQGSVVLVLSGRAGEDILKQLFIQNGYKPRVLFEAKVCQAHETTVKTLAQAEEQGYEFFFYKDPLCEERITVEEAEDRRLQGKDSYHKIFIFEGILTEKK